MFFLALKEFGYFGRQYRRQCLHGIDKIYAAIAVNDLAERFDFIEIGKRSLFNARYSDVTDKGHGVFIARAVAGGYEPANIVAET